MGYRNKIALLSTKVHNEIKDMTLSELKVRFKQNGKHDWLSCYNIAKEVYEIGKYWDHGFLDPYQKDIFSNKEVTDHFNEEKEFVFIGKDGLKAVIQSYHKKISDYYQSILTPDPKDVEFNWHTTPEQHVRSMADEWSNKFGLAPYDLSDQDQIVSSWKFEYTIFELVRIYKSVDEAKHLVCLTGW